MGKVERAVERLSDARGMYGGGVHHGVDIELKTEEWEM